MGSLKHYNYLQLRERERQQAKDEKDDLVPEVLAEILHAAISLPSRLLKEIALRQAMEVVVNLKKQYRYLGILKNTIWDVLAKIGKYYSCSTAGNNHFN